MSQCQQQFSTAPSALPAAYRQHAANLARWFPEVLLALGAPGLEESFAPAGPYVTVGPAGQTIEVVLERRPPSQPLMSAGTDVSTVAHVSPAPVTATTTSSLSSTLAGLEALTVDFEALAAGRFSCPRPTSNAQNFETYIAGAPQNTDEGLSRRLDNVAEEILKLATQLQVSGVLSPNVENTDIMVREQPVAPPTTEKARVISSQSPPSSSKERKRDRGKDHLKKYSTAPACADPDHEVAFVKELTPTTRGGRAHQGQAAARQAGRSRALPKAALWRTQRDSSMKISINKVPQLKEDPASPKFEKSTKVWGSSNKTKATATVRRNSLPCGDPCTDRSAAAIKARIDRKLSLLFGPSRITRHQSLPSVDDSEDPGELPVGRYDSH